MVGIDPIASDRWTVATPQSASSGDAFAAALAQATAPTDLGSWGQWGHIDPATGAYLDNVTGRHAYYGPDGEPARAWQPGQAVAAGMQTVQQPDGTWALYRPGTFTYADAGRASNAPATASDDHSRVGAASTSSGPRLSDAARAGIAQAEATVNYGGAVTDVVAASPATEPYGPGFDTQGQPTTGGDWVFQIGGGVADPNGQWVRIG